MFFFCAGPTAFQLQPGPVFSAQIATTTTLLCEVTHDDATSVTYSWTKDGAPITFDDRVSFTDPSNSGNLMIRSVSFEDGGVYQCTVSTLLGNREAPRVHSTPTLLLITGQSRLLFSFLAFSIP